VVDRRDEVMPRKFEHRICAQCGGVFIMPIVDAPADYNRCQQCWSGDERRDRAVKSREVRRLRRPTRPR
jgi:hypothetical protein